MRIKLKIIVRQMKKINKSFVFKLITTLSITLLLVNKVYAKNKNSDFVSVKEVVESTFRHHPLILIQLKEFEQASQYTRQALGAFDLNLKSEAQGYTDGYYDGKAFSAFLEKPLYYMNSKAYGGYRNSDGEFPIYSQEQVTLDQGEAFAGVMVSLLRNRSIDQKRFKYILANQDLVQSELVLKQQFIELQTMAAEAYYKWLSHLERVRVYKELLSLAEDRIKNFNIRIKKGDLAKIYGTENEQYILKRKISLNKENLKLYEAALYLSLFYRDHQGVPIILRSDNLTRMKELNTQKIKTESELLNLVNEQDLMIKTVVSQIEQVEANRKMGVNELLPKLDLKYEVSQDRGNGDPNLDPLEQKAYLSIEVPIERRLGTGQVRAAKAKKAALIEKVKFKKEKNRIEVLTLLNNLSLLNKNFDLTKKEIELADKLRDSELIKFNKGASDFILVNLREENLAQSKIRNIKAYLDFNTNFIELQKMAVDFIIPPEYDKK